MILLSVLNQFVERTANFTELVILKQVPSLSFKSFYGLFECSSDHVVNLPECTVCHCNYFTQYLYF